MSSRFSPTLDNIEFGSQVISKADLSDHRESSKKKTKMMKQKISIMKQSSLLQHEFNRDIFESNNDRNSPLFKTQRRNNPLYIFRNPLMSTQESQNSSDP